MKLRESSEKIGELTMANDYLSRKLKPIMIQCLAEHEADDGGKVYLAQSVTTQHILVDPEVDRLRRASRQATAETPR